MKTLYSPQPSLSPPTSIDWDHLFCDSLEFQHFHGIIPTIDFCFQGDQAAMVLNLSTGLGKIRKLFDITDGIETTWRPMSIIKVQLQVLPIQHFKQFFEAHLTMKIDVKIEQWVQHTYSDKILLDKNPLNYAQLNEADLAFLLAMKS